MGCRVNRQGMLGEARPWRNVGRHLTCKVELPIGCFCEQRDHQVFQCNDTNAKLHQLGVCQLRNFPLRVAWDLALLRTKRSRAALAVPPRKRPLALF
jgi:hypothetical protein